MRTLRSFTSRPDSGGPRAHASPGPTWSRRLTPLVAGVLVLAGCAGPGDEPAPGSGSPTPIPSEPATSEPSSSTSSPGGSDPSSSPTGSSTDTGTAGSGCPATNDGPPPGAAVAEIVDVDGDGRPDSAWITAGADRAIGVTTASGATFSAPISSASPIPASAVVGSVATTDAGDAPVVLVDLGREAQVFALTGCAVTQTVDDAGQPYVFDRGFGGQGTGVGCSDVDGAPRLAGLLAEETSDGWTVTRTLIDLSDGARLAGNGSVEVVATAAAADDPVVTTAQEVSCGDQVAGAGGLTEPADG
ncbi:hypothetical protein C8046_13860 [Serinibacter arcticus]|uniref:Uncharacterized protein n=1 Tax=Serinibacter arcticus TaxID=1655435 RepID=A0A2U1ZX52_9MICO|nr:hypothetical protein [Serinibacter arcticus]PWD51565.1 hypothetical protein C8046_13860 [Serinibacter arcticus]